MATKISAKHRGEFCSREFWGEEQWKKWRGEVDEMNAFKKSIKGKPTLDQAIQLLINSEDSEYREFLLSHIPNNVDCVCVRCQHKKTGFIDNKSFSQKLGDILQKF